MTDLQQLTCAKIALSLDKTDLQNFTISIANITGDTVSVEYSGIDGNLPNKYNNFVGIWAGALLNLDADPVAKNNIGLNVQPGSMVLDSIDIACSSYTVVYGVGNDNSTICASALIYADGHFGPSDSVNIGLNSVGATSLSLSYRTLPGYLPYKYKNWVGLWEGSAIPYNSEDPLAKIQVKSNVSQNNLVLNNVVMKRNTEYTLVYFVGESFTNAAALLRFNTADYIKC